MNEPGQVIFDELIRVFDVLNEKLFDAKLVRPNFSVQIKKKVSLRWSPESGMILGSDFPTLEHSDLLTTMLHEMIHLKNYQLNVQDCTTNQYHNKHFLNAALRVGLVVIKHKTQGWAITTTQYPRNVVEREFVRQPEKAAYERCADAFLAAKLDKTLFRRSCSEIRSKIKDEKPPKTYFLKYVCNCPTPHNSIRSGRRPDGPNALNIQCMNCHSKYVCVSNLTDEVEESQ